MSDSTPGVIMPKTTVDENHFSAAGKHQVRPSWQMLVVKPETVTHGMNKAPDSHLWGSIPALNPAHILGAAFWG
jgi:hypothetical protein